MGAKASVTPIFMKRDGVSGRKFTSSSGMSSVAWAGSAMGVPSNSRATPSGPTAIQ
ncbi:hypothetical protein [Azospirillum baldaniorum]|uniref:hypothetical protein n=1 Tax=Azospirillum baldaniorum TaxID=1064539 RepID=UPI001FCB4F17|nr:hypothetical protein [Azospirillum baldaniorum]